MRSVMAGGGGGGGEEGDLHLHGLPAVGGEEEVETTVVHVNSVGEVRVDHLANLGGAVCSEREREREREREEKVGSKWETGGGGAGGRQGDGRWNLGT